MNLESDYNELDIQAREASTPEIARLTLQEALAASAPMPPHALFLGIAADGLPILLHLADPAPGPLLIVAETSAGKTTFLQAVALTCSLSDVSANIHFCVLTRRPEEWTNLAILPQCLGILAPEDVDTPHMLADLLLWAREQRQANEWMCFLLDDLTITETLPPQALENLRWLLARGPHRGLWPLVTLNSADIGHVAAWLTAFHTRVLGRISQPEHARGLGGAEWQAHLETGQFVLREGRDWLRFWVPELDKFGG